VRLGLFITVPLRAPSQLNSATKGRLCTAEHGGAFELPMRSRRLDAARHVQAAPLHLTWAAPQLAAEQ
jgi:hypothetical protein